MVSLSLSLSPCVRVSVLGEYLGGDGDTVNLSITKSWKTDRPSTCPSLQEKEERKKKKKRRNRENQIQEKTFYNIVYKSLSLMPARLKFKKKKIQTTQGELK